MESVGGSKTDVGFNVITAWDLGIAENQRYTFDCLAIKKGNSK
jgi:hypothetical protein